MKLTYTLSESSNLDSKTAIDKIVLELNNNKYRVLDTTNNKVEFDDNSFKFMWSFETVGRIDGGTFKVEVLKNNIEVTLDYNINVLPILIGIIGIIILFITESQYIGAIISIIFCFIIIYRRTIKTQTTARDLLFEIFNGSFC
ncbi:hypothetical protein ACPPVU_00155 [Mucilaginibacter sp. McL0603]|uniref:hypothetical protein n=1 Tax=Mucilaginibacter sp. McL0603 TaxID=3415670 RepID=UPI003CF04DA2